MAPSLERLAAAWALLGGAFVASIMIVTSINVGSLSIDRLSGLFDLHLSGLPGYEDFVRLAVSCAALMFLPYCQQRRAHVKVDLFVSMLPKVMRTFLDKCWLAVMLLLALFLAYWMTMGMLETRSDNVLSPVLGWSEWPFYGPGIVSLLIWALICGSQLVERGDDV
jgi:TRAP-type C4-dicarboxylate transport system permease small subunit